ncbi:hypothetical protein F5Y15DRAFT_413354 [Xylariaceae sp. FL0016]|nr:hypothetical protein F5Y15DRAFT_413354 [Xylariaceae sp. FL0016]
MNTTFTRRPPRFQPETDMTLRALRAQHQESIDEFKQDIYKLKSTNDLALRDAETTSLHPKDAPSHADSAQASAEEHKMKLILNNLQPEANFSGPKTTPDSDAVLLVPSTEPAASACVWPDSTPFTVVKPPGRRGLRTMHGKRDDKKKQRGKMGAAGHAALGAFTGCVYAAWVLVIASYIIDI